MVDRSIADGSSLERAPETARSVPFETVVAEYARLWDYCVIRDDKLAEVDTNVDKVTRNQPRYEAVAATTGVPWWFLAAFHMRESGFSFKGHLHNGDPLSAPTAHVPAGRPAGSGPFTWEQSAADALAVEDFTGASDWRVTRVAYRFELFNGLGYRKFHSSVLSPYLWSFSQHYTQGKYAEDGRFDAGLVDRQCGTMVLLKRLQELHVVRVDEVAPFISAPAPVAHTITEATTATPSVLIAAACCHLGEPYKLGAIVPFSKADFAGPWDCAEFASWLLYHTTGMVFGCVDNHAPADKLNAYSGAWYRDAMAQGTDVLPVEAAKTTAGLALVRKPVIRSDGTVVRIGHVALADGTGGTVEAMNTRNGVARGRIDGRGFDLAVRLPGIDYGDRLAATGSAARPSGVDEALASTPLPAEDTFDAAVEATTPQLEEVFKPDERQPVHRAAMAHAPWRAICNILCSGTGARVLQGTGWMANPRTVVTAGHVLFDKKELGGRAGSVTVTVARYGADYLAVRTGQSFSVHPRYESANDPNFDIGCIHLDTPIDGADYFGMLVADDVTLQGKPINIAGYPNDKDDGQVLYHHTDTIIKLLPQRIAYRVDTSLGQSGSPVWMVFNDRETRVTRVIGVHTSARAPTQEAFKIDGNSGTRISAEIFKWISALL